jgi:hypothetical protein
MRWVMSTAWSEHHSPGACAFMCIDGAASDELVGPEML